MITATYHSEPKDVVLIKTSTNERTGKQYPVLKFGEYCTLFPSFEQVYDLRDKIDHYLSELAIDASPTTEVASDAIL